MAKYKDKHKDGIKIITRFLAVKYKNGKVVDQCNANAESKEEALELGEFILGRNEADRQVAEKKRRAEALALKKQADAASKTVTLDIVPPAGETFGD